MAELNKIAGYATVVYSKRCLDQPEQNPANGEQYRLPMAQGKAGAINNSPARTMDVLSGNKGFRPQWGPQMVERATQLAASNAAAALSAALCFGKAASAAFFVGEWRWH